MLPLVVRTYVPPVYSLSKNKFVVSVRLSGMYVVCVLIFILRFIGINLSFTLYWDSEKNSEIVYSYFK